MLRAVPDNSLLWRFTIFDHHNAIAKSDIGWVRDAGELHLEAANYRVYREKLFNGVFLLEKDGQEIVRAEKPSALLRSFKVKFNDKDYILEAESVLQLTTILRENDKKIGTIKPENAFTRKAVIALPVRIFTTWLTFIL